MWAIRRAIVIMLGIVILTGLVFAGEMWRHGYRLYAVQTGSMTPSVRPGDAVLVRPTTSVRVGDVITFHPGPNSTTTHRVFSITAEGVQTKGDANRTPDFWHLRPAQIVGQVVAHIPRGGYVLFFFKQPTGSLGVVAFLLAVVFAWVLFFGAPPDRSHTVSRSRHRRGRGAVASA